MQFRDFGSMAAVVEPPRLPLEEAPVEPPRMPLETLCEYNVYCNFRLPKTHLKHFFVVFTHLKHLKL